MFRGLLSYMSCCEKETKEDTEEVFSRAANTSRSSSHSASQQQGLGIRKGVIQQRNNGTIRLSNSVCDRDRLSHRLEVANDKHKKLLSVKMNKEILKKSIPVDEQEEEKVPQSIPVCMQEEEKAPQQMVEEEKQESVVSFKPVEEEKKIEQEEDGIRPGEERFIKKSESMPNIQPIPPQERGFSQNAKKKSLPFNSYLLAPDQNEVAVQKVQKFIEQFSKKILVQKRSKWSILVFEVHY